MKKHIEYRIVPDWIGPNINVLWRKPTLKKAREQCRRMIANNPRNNGYKIVKVTTTFEIRK